MATISANLALVLPESTDKVDVSVLSNDFTKIDTEWGKLIKQDNVANNLTTSEEGKVLDARQGRELANQLKAMGDDKVGLTDVIDNLESTEKNKPLSANMGRELKAQLAGKHILLNGSFRAGGWQGVEPPFTQTVTGINGLLGSDVPIADVDMSGADTAEAGVSRLEAWMLIGRMTTGDSTITGYCYEEKPTVDVPFFLRVLR